MDKLIISSEKMGKYGSPSIHKGGFLYTLEIVGEIYYKNGVIVKLPQSEHFVDGFRSRRAVACVEFERAPVGSFYRKEFKKEENQDHEVFIYEKVTGGWVQVSYWSEEGCKGDWPVGIIEVPYSERVTEKLLDDLNAFE